MNEVVFLLGNEMKKDLFRPLLKLLKKRIIQNYSEELQPQIYKCYHWEQCYTQFRLVHGVFLILELLPKYDQQNLLSKVCSMPFNHLLRLNCCIIAHGQLLLLLSLIVRRLMVVVKKIDYFKAQSEIEPYINIVSEIIINIVKMKDIFTDTEQVTQLQADIAILFSK